MSRYTTEDVDRITTYRDAGMSWREIVEATGITIHWCQRLHREGIRPNRKPRKYAAGERETLTVNGETRNLREWAVEWLRRRHAEHEITDEATSAAVKILRRRVEDGWPPENIVTIGPGFGGARKNKAETERAEFRLSRPHADEFERTVAKWPKAHPCAPDTAKYLDLQRTVARLV